MRTISPICGKENLASLVQEFRRQSRHSVESCMINLGAGGRGAALWAADGTSRGEGIATGDAATGFMTRQIQRCLEEIATDSAWGFGAYLSWGWRLAELLSGNLWFLATVSLE